MRAVQQEIAAFLPCTMCAQSSESAAAGKKTGKNTKQQRQVGAHLSRIEGMRSRRPLATRKLHASSVCDILTVIVASCAAGDRCFTSLVPCACFCLGTHAVHARASCEEPKSRRACLCSKNCQPLLHRSPTSLYCSNAPKKNNSLALAMDVGTGGYL